MSGIKFPFRNKSLNPLDGGHLICQRQPVLFIRAQLRDSVAERLPTLLWGFLTGEVSLAFIFIYFQKKKKVLRLIELTD